MNKWIYAVSGTVVAAGIIGGVGLIASWMSDVNKDRVILRELVWKDHYLNGNISAAPVSLSPKPIAPVIPLQP